MVDFDKAVGTAGTMRIRDTGTTVEFWILCSDPSTNTGGYSWSGVVNGVGVGGTTSLPAGFGSRLLGSWAVSTTQTVTFHQNATGTAGLGGAADHSAPISRGGLPDAPHPYPVGTSGFSEVKPTSVRYTMQDGSDGGSSITSRAVQFGNADFSDSVIVGVDSSGSALFTGLIPGRAYYARARVQNAVGVSGWSVTTSTRTTGFLNVSNGSAWSPWVVDVSNGSVWVRQIVEVSDGTNWIVQG